MSIEEVRKALANTRSWAAVRRRLRALSDSELAEAERFERLGARRQNMMRLLLAERKRRQGRAEKMIRLKVEVVR